jgi:hypothetical protein
MTEGMPTCDAVMVQGTCQVEDYPSYADCEGDGCAYYTDFPEDCGKHDDPYGDPEDMVSPKWCRLSANAFCFKKGTKHPRQRRVKEEGCCV